MGDMATKRLLPVICIFLFVLILISGACSKNNTGGGTSPTKSTSSSSQSGPLAYVPVDLTVKADEDFSIQLEATGGEPPYSWKVKAGSLLPTGFRLTSKGVLQGNPSITGDADQATTTPFTVIIRDSKGQETDVELTMTFVR